MISPMPCHISVSCGRWTGLLHLISSLLSTSLKTIPLVVDRLSHSSKWATTLKVLNGVILSFKVSISMQLLKGARIETEWNEWKNKSGLWPVCKDVANSGDVLMAVWQHMQPFSTGTPHCSNVVLFQPLLSDVMHLSVIRAIACKLKCFVCTAKFYPDLME